MQNAVELVCRKSFGWMLGLALLGGIPLLDTRAVAETGSGSPSSIAVIRPWFDRNDEVAALEAVRVALTEVGDGSSYVWYRHGGRLSGIVKPTQSFEDMRGRVCRHLVVTMSASGYSRTASAIACRLPDGTWTIDG